MSNTVRLTLVTDPQVTCKDRWHFMLSPTGNGDYLIMDIEATGKDGCAGHPKTIAALLRGRRVGDINLTALADTPCSREQSCGQTLGVLVRDLKKSLDMI
jgi:hypothetical protein